MIIGTGIDVVEIIRIKELVEKNDRFAGRILSEEEFTHFAKLNGKRKIEFLAGRFAAKEAYAKAKGTGIGQHLTWHDMVILNDEKGKPFLKINSEENVHISISHTNFCAVASIIIESLSC